MSNRNQYVSINDFYSGLTTIYCGVPQGHVLQPLLFLLNINDFNQAIKFCNIYYFVDDTSFFHIGKSISRVNELANIRLN